MADGSRTLSARRESAGAVPRHQAALGLLLLRLLPGLTSAPKVFDPVFTAVDCAALAQLGFQVPHWADV